jgi:predicted nucleic acid-binding protein
LVSLERTGLLFVLESLYQTIRIPTAVAREWSPTLPAWIQECPVQNQALVQSLRLELGAGEAEAIALAIELSAARLILDEKKARRIAAHQFQLPVTGTLAILLLAKERGLIPQVREALDALSNGGFHMSEALFRDVLKRAGEEP